MKIPFERTIAAAYKFAFTNFLSIVGICWFPFVVVGLVAAGLAYSLLPPILELFKTEPEKWNQAQIVPLILPLAGSVVLLIAVWLFAIAMVNVGVMRKALGQHPGPVFIFFSLGSQVWRMIGAYFLLMLLVWGVLIAMSTGIGTISYLLSKVNAVAQGLVTALLICAALVWGIYAAVRVQFFLPAVVVAENNIGIRRSWHLGKGNFWRIVGISILVTLPAGMAVSTITSSMFQMSMNVPITPQMTPEQWQHYFTAMLTALRGIGPIFAVVELVYMIAVTGLSIGAVANAYNLVTGAADAAPGSTKAPA